MPNTQYTITAVYKSAGDIVTSTVVKPSGADGTLGLEWSVGMQTALGTYGIMIAGGGD